MLCPLITERLKYLYDLERDLLLSKKEHFTTLKDFSKSHPFFISIRLAAQRITDCRLLDLAHELSKLDTKLFTISGWESFAGVTVRAFSGILKEKRVVLEHTLIEDTFGELPAVTFEVTKALNIRASSTFFAGTMPSRVLQVRDRWNPDNYIFLVAPGAPYRDIILWALEQEFKSIYIQRDFNIKTEALFSIDEFRSLMDAVEEQRPYIGTGEPQSILSDEKTINVFQNECLESIPEPVEVIGLERNPYSVPLFGCQAGISMCDIEVKDESVAIRACETLEEVICELPHFSSQSVIEVWQNFQLWKQYGSRELKDKCQYCTYRQLCGGCRGWAEAFTGESNGTDRSCWETRKILTPDDVSDWT